MNKNLMRFANGTSRNSHFYKTLKRPNGRIGADAAGEGVKGLCGLIVTMLGKYNNGKGLESSAMVEIAIKITGNESFSKNDFRQPLQQLLDKGYIYVSATRGARDACIYKLASKGAENYKKAKKVFIGPGK